MTEGEAEFVLKVGKKFEEPANLPLSGLDVFLVVRLVLFLFGLVEFVYALACSGAYLLSLVIALFHDECSLSRLLSACRTRTLPRCTKRFWQQSTNLQGLSVMRGLRFVDSL